MVDRRIEQLKQAREARKAGNYNFIPWFYHFPKLSKVIPGLLPGIMYKILSFSGIGKTKLAKFLSVIMPYELYKKHGIKVHTIYFALEESKEEFIDSLIVMMLKTKYNISIDVLQLNSYYEELLSDEVVEALELVKEDVEDILKHVTIVDTISNPTGMYKFCRDFSEKHGTHHRVDKKFTKIVNGKEITEVKNVYSHYEPNDPELNIIVVTDHMALMNTEKDPSGKHLSKHQTMELWSAEYCRKQMSKHWKYIILNVQQLAAAGEDVTHFKAKRLEPSLDKVGNNKEVIRDDFVVISLFAPDRYQIATHRGYNVKKLQDNYRELGILKNRIGASNKNLALYFDGATNEFHELPPPNSPEIQKYYN